MYYCFNVITLRYCFLFQVSISAVTQRCKFDRIIWLQEHEYKKAWNTLKVFLKVEINVCNIVFYTMCTYNRHYHVVTMCKGFIVRTYSAFHYFAKINYTTQTITNDFQQNSNSCVRVVCFIFGVLLRISLEPYSLFPKYSFCKL